MACESTPNRRGVTEIVAVIGMLITVGYVVTALIAWAFSRGFFDVLGVPSYVITFRSGLEIFPGVALEFTLKLLILISLGFILGYFLTKKERLSRNDKLFMLLFIVIIFTLINALAKLFIAGKTLETVISMISTYLTTNNSLLLVSYFFIGFMSSFPISDDFKVFLITTLFIVVIALEGVAQLENGQNTAKEFLRVKGSINTMYEIPAVSVLANTDLGWLDLGLGGFPRRNQYFYGAKEPYDLRLLYKDENHFYFFIQERFESSMKGGDKVTIRQGGFNNYLHIVERSKIDNIIYNLNMPLLDKNYWKCIDCHN